MTFRWWWFPGYLLALPGSLLGLVLAILYVPRRWRFSQGCIEAIAPKMIGRPAAQTHGFIIYYASDRLREWEAIRVHERVHVVQGLIGSVFYILAYALSFAGIYVWRVVRHGDWDWRSAYLMIPFEKQAHRIRAEFEQGKRPDAWGSRDGQ